MNLNKISILTIYRNVCIHSSIIIIIEFLLITNVWSESKTIRNIKTIELNSQLFRVIVNRNNNDIIVGARNHIFRLSSDLRILEQFTTGPINDSIDCLPPPFDCEANKKLVDNDNRVLIFYKDHRLLACGDAYQGMCYKFSANNLSFNQFYGQPNNSINFMGSKSSSFAILKSYSLGYPTLYVAHAYDGRPLQFSPPSYSRRILLKTGMAFRDPWESSTSFTEVDFNPIYKQTFKVKYIYGFNTTVNSYFVSIQPKNVRTDECETKLIRICESAGEFISYMEIPLSCNSNHNNSAEELIYSIGETAYFGEIGSKKLSKLLELNKESDFHLFVSFGVPTVGAVINRTLGSAICAFNIDQINNYFDIFSQQCYRKNNTKVQGLEVITSEKICRPLKKNERVSTPLNYWCGRGLKYIETREPLVGSFLTSIKGWVTSLVFGIQNRKTVAVVGTEDGLVMKLLIDRLSIYEKPLFSMNISNQLMNRSIRPNPVFDNKERYLYLLSGKQLIEFPFGSCSLYTDCTSCLNPFDPLRCVWCDYAYCASVDDCEHRNKTAIWVEENDLTAKNKPVLEHKLCFTGWTNISEYSPKLYSYEPKATIRSGNTNIIINGVNMKSIANPRMLVIAFSRTISELIQYEGQCQVNSLGLQMVCQTPPIEYIMFKNKITNKNRIQTIDTTVETKLRFILNNFMITPNYRLIYFIDPTFYSFKEQTRIVFLEDPILLIDGKNLSDRYPIDIRVGFQRISCQLIQVYSNNTLFCKIQFNELLFKTNGIEHIVNISVGDIKFSPGNVMFVSNQNNVNIWTIITSTLIIIILIAVIVAALTYYLKIKGIIQKKPRSPSPPFIQLELQETESGENLIQNSQNSEAQGGKRYVVCEETMNLLRAEEILIDKNYISLEEVIGQGYFGCVYKAVLHSSEGIEREVAVKTLKNSLLSDEMIESFLKEGLIMKDFKDQHVLTLIGVSFEEDGSPLVVLPFMKNGDLLLYIREETNQLTVENLLMFAIDIAKGMDYLSSKRYVHRDLAARNCMLDSEMCIKVSDFGLTRDIYENDYYSSDNKKTKLPVKWMAPECFEKGTYNTKTDVWSYGVLVWELLTRGVTPYPNVENWEILNYLKQGRRMSRPIFCPKEVYFILLKCWSEDSEHRPTFSELVVEIDCIFTNLENRSKKEWVELDKCYTYIDYPIPNPNYIDS